MFFLFSRFLVKFFINKNRHNSIANNDTDMELSPLFKLEKIKYSDVKKTENEIMPGIVKSYHCHFSNLWWNWDNPEAGLRMHVP